MSNEYMQLCRATEFLESKYHFTPDSVIVLGSGLGSFADSVDVMFSMPYSDIPGFKTTKIEGHAGKLIYTRVSDRNVAILSGRYHCYEGYTAKETVFPLRVLRLLGAKTIYITCAAGGITASKNSFMIINDIINLSGSNPLTGTNIDELGEKFPDMTEIFDKNLIRAAQSVIKNNNIDISEGVYCQTPGPMYETPAEVRYMRMIGADAVGMSAAVEAIAAKHCGYRVFGLALITNAAAGLTDSIDHSDIVDSARQYETAFAKIITLCLKHRS